MFNFFKKNKKTKEAVLELIALAWNSLDSSTFADFLDSAVSYRSYGVRNVMNGKGNYLEYIDAKFASFKNNGAKFNASVVTLDGEPAVEIKNENSTSRNAYLTIEYDGEKIQSMLMRPDTIYTLEDLQDNDKFYDVLSPILDKIHSGIEQKIASMGFNMERDFEWLQYWPYFNSPQFQHLCFRLKHVIYSLRIVIYDFDNRGMYLHNANESAQLMECKKHKLQACTVSIDVNAINYPTIEFTESQEEVDFTKIDDIEGGNMSDWEINHYAVYYVLGYLENMGCSDMVFTDAPSFLPQIRCTIDGVPSYVYVHGHPNALPSEPINKSQCDNVGNGMKGYYADVPMSFIPGNNFNFHDEAIYRGCPGNVLAYPKITNENPLLIPIESAYEKYGFVESDLFNVEV